MREGNYETDNKDREPLPELLSPPADAVPSPWQSPFQADDGLGDDTGADEVDHATGMHDQVTRDREPLPGLLSPPADAVPSPWQSPFQADNGLSDNTGADEVDHATGMHDQVTRDREPLPGLLSPPADAVPSSWQSPFQADDGLSDNTGAVEVDHATGMHDRVTRSGAATGVAITSG